MTQNEKKLETNENKEVPKISVPHKENSLKPKIIDCRKRNGITKYLLRSDSEQFWLSRDEITEDLLNEFQALQRNRRSARRRT